MGHRRFLLGSAFLSLAFSTTANAQAINLDQLTATQAAADLCAGKITSKALTSAALARAKELTKLNAFITLDEAGAMKAAEAFDAGRKKGACKPLGGVPVVVKDNTEVAGLPSSAGTPALKSYVPRKDAPVVAKLRASGAIIIGKTNMHELAFGISGYNGAFKTAPLRDLSTSGPYMHTGALPNLEAIIDHYDRGGAPGGFSGVVDERIGPLQLTPLEKAQLLAFLLTLDADPVTGEPTNAEK